MPIDAILSISGRVAASGDRPALFDGYVTPPEEYAEEGYGEGGIFAGAASAPLLITGAVSRALVDAFEGPSLFYGLRIKLNGEWVPDEDIVGAVTIKESRDTQLATASFTVVGRRYSVLRTVTTWTRVPVEIHFQNGPARRVLDYLRFAGFVITGSQMDDFEPMVRVDCGDSSILFNELVTCLEVEPFSGMTRGDIVRALCADAGLAVDVPDGAAYDKPFSSLNQRLFETLRPFGEPEAWYWRTRYSDGVLEVYKPELKLAPLPPDHEWGPESIESFELHPPAGSPSRWVVRGFAVVVVDELGVTTTFTLTEVESIYAPKVAVSEQQTDGDIVPTGMPPETESLRLTTRLVDQQAKRSGVLLWQQTREWGYKNPASAKYYTPDDAVTAGPVPGGYYFALAYVDEEGAYVSWLREAFVLISERTLRPTYDVDLNETGSRTEERAWGRRTMGVRVVGSADLDVPGACVGDDDQSYFSTVGTGGPKRPIETFDLARALDVAFTRDDTGAVVREQQDTWTYYAPKCLIGPGTHLGRWLCYDGTGQAELIAQWKRTGSKTVVNVITEGRLAGTVEVEAGYRVAKKLDGDYDWGGGFKSNLAVESFQTTTARNIAYRLITTESYEKTTTEAGKNPTIETFGGRVPTPRWKTSPWTRLVQEPIEYVLEDATAELWFGPSKEVVTNDYLLNLTEAQLLVERRRRLRLADRITIKRAEANARPGETVLVTWPSAGLRHRCLLVEQEISRDILQADASATYALERYR